MFCIIRMGLIKIWGTKIFFIKLDKDLFAPYFQMFT